jgi:hypothetical protein
MAGYIPCGRSLIVILSIKNIIFYKDKGEVPGVTGNEFFFACGAQLIKKNTPYRATNRDKQFYSPAAGS